jgi:hypothetical protein
MNITHDGQWVIIINSSDIIKCLEKISDMRLVRGTDINKTTMELPYRILFFPQLHNEWTLHLLKLGSTVWKLCQASNTQKVV